LPDPEKLLTLLRQATMLSRATPGRIGRLVELAGATDVLVAGDLHGHIGNFQQVLKVADLGTHPKRHLVMQELIHGPFRYGDGADKSHQAVDLWAALKCQFPDRVHYLPGNHEMAQWTNRAIAKNEYDLNAGFLDGVRSAYGAKAVEIYAAYLDLFRALPLAVRTPNRVFLSHSLPPATALAKFDAPRLRSADYSDDDLRPGGAAYSLVWGRDTSVANAAEFLKKVDADLLITGHVPCDKGFSVPNDRQVILDTLSSPAAYCLFPADRPLTHQELLDCVKLL
jgi:hypothetical protein